jgi:hypothetical protein
LRSVLPVLVLGSFLTTVGWAQKKSVTKRPPSTALKMQTQGAGSISVVLAALPGGGPLVSELAGKGALDLGQAAYGAGSHLPNVEVRTLRDRMVVSTRFGLAVRDPSGHFASASVLASLAYSDSSRVLRLDGVRLSTVPQLIQAQARLGVTSSHRLEIEVPTLLTEKDAQMRNAILFQVIPN